MGSPRASIIILSSAPAMICEQDYSPHVILIWHVSFKDCLLLVLLASVCFAQMAKGNMAQYGEATSEVPVQINEEEVAPLLLSIASD